jgi:polar amino acid transport system substrate-binding protein
MSGVEYPAYKASFEMWFGETPPEPQIGFPAEHR